MIRVLYAPIFLRTLKKLEQDLIDETLEKIDLLKEEKNYASLKVHKLHGRFKKYFSFYVNYKIRIVFRYLDKSKIILIDIGDHDVYKD
ncbi:MAG: hypothetical protein WCP15_04145 [bacterium]